MKYRIVEAKDCTGRTNFWPEYKGHWLTEFGFWNGIYSDMLDGFEDADILPDSYEEAMRRIEAYDAQVVNDTKRMGTQVVAKIYYP